MDGREDWAVELRHHGDTCRPGVRPRVRSRAVHRRMWIAAARADDSRQHQSHYPRCTRHAPRIRDARRVFAWIVAERASSRVSVTEVARLAWIGFVLAFACS